MKRQNGDRVGKVVLNRHAVGKPKIVGLRIEVVGVRAQLVIKTDGVGRHGFIKRTADIFESDLQISDIVVIGSVLRRTVRIGDLSVEIVHDLDVILCGFFVGHTVNVGQILFSQPLFFRRDLLNRHAGIIRCNACLLKRHIKRGAFLNGSCDVDRMVELDQQCFKIVDFAL